jgi:small-conductance mechanosensitive channel
MYLLCLFYGILTTIHLHWANSLFLFISNKVYYIPIYIYSCIGYLYLYSSNIFTFSNATSEAAAAAAVAYASSLTSAAAARLAAIALWVISLISSVFAKSKAVLPSLKTKISIGEYIQYNVLRLRISRIYNKVDSLNG